MTDKVFACKRFNGSSCLEWVELNHQASFFEQFNQLTLSDVSAISGATALLFGVAWCMNVIEKFIREKMSNY